METKSKKTTKVSEGTTENKQKKDEKSENEKTKTDFWEEAGENISMGAKVVGDTVNEYAQTIGEKAKEAYKSGSEFTLEMVHNAQEVIDNYRHKLEINRLSDERDKELIEFGKHLYRTVKSGKNKLPEDYLDDTDVQSLLEKIVTIDKKIIEIGEQENK